MKKRSFVIIIVILLITTSIFFLKNRTPLQTQSVSVITNTPTPSAKKQSIEFYFKGMPIRISWAAAKPEQVNLFSNLQTKQTAEQIKSQKNCKILVNGGFYSKANTHLGLVISNNELLSETLQSQLFNGFLSITSENVMINSASSDAFPRIAIQSGPLLMQSGKLLILAINNDQADRRIVAATNDSNRLIFLVVYRQNSELQGPLLQDLPEIIDLFIKQTGINIIDAINLDGGSASAFITDFESLTEISTIGSYFCVI